MSTASEHTPNVSIPLALFNRMALCYYGEGPRHPRASERPESPTFSERPHQPNQPDLPVGRNPISQGASRMDSEGKGEKVALPMIPGMEPATPYARRMMGLPDVEQTIPGIDTPTPPVED